MVCIRKRDVQIGSTSAWGSAPRGHPEQCRKVNAIANKCQTSAGSAAKCASQDVRNEIYCVDPCTRCGDGDTGDRIWKVSSGDRAHEKQVL